jgi:hypothetical protein
MKRSSDNAGKKRQSSVEKIVFLVWARQSIRASGISNRIGASLYLMSSSKIKHGTLIVKTLQILRREKPSIIICQSPPISLVFVAYVYKHLFGYTSKPKVLIDIHSGAIYNPWSKRVTKLLMKLAFLNIVTNTELQNDLRENYQVDSLVLEDPIPDLTDILSSTKYQSGHFMQLKSAFSVAFISSFSDDEPLLAVFNAASQIPDVEFYITGDNTNSEQRIFAKKPDNVNMTGYLDYGAYIRLLQTVDVIMDLTTLDNTMLAGAYESVALGQPLITSNWNPLRRYFNMGTIHINNSPREIIEAITIARTKKEELSKQMHELKIEKLKQWDEKISKFHHLLYD